MDWTQQIFAYCERGLDPAFWAEPLNAITNVAFLIAAGIAFLAWSAQAPERRGLMELIMIVIVTIIGIGSFLFHTYAQRWAALADTLPIGIFMMVYMGYTLRAYFRMPLWAVGIGLIAFFASLAYASAGIRCGGGPCLNGSVAYFPAFFALVGLGAVLIAQRHPAGGYLLSAGLVFAVSLSFRSLDQALCGYTAINGLDPIGLHFLWHCLNATLLYLLLVAAIRHGRSGRDAQSDLAPA